MFGDALSICPPYRRHFFYFFSEVSPENHSRETRPVPIAKRVSMTKRIIGHGFHRVARETTESAAMSRRGSTQRRCSHKQTDDGGSWLSATKKEARVSRMIERHQHAWESSCHQPISSPRFIVDPALEDATADVLDVFLSRLFARLDHILGDIYAK